MLQSRTHRLEEEEGIEGQDEYMKGRRRFRRKMNGMWSEHRQGMSNYEPCLEIGRYNIERTEVAGAVFGAEQRCVPKPKDVHYEALFKNFKSRKKNT